jgi:hypothetical protein
MAAVLLPPADLITDAVLQFFDGLMPKAVCYDGRFDGDPVQPPPRYKILYRIPGGATDLLPSLDDHRDTTRFAYQLTCVGSARNVAERLAYEQLTAWTQRDTVTGLWTRPLNLPDGWAVAQRLGPDEAPGVDPSGQQPTTAYQVPLRIQLTVTPVT